MTLVEARTEIQSKLIPETTATENPEGLSKRIIDKFRTDLGLPESSSFSIVNNRIKVVYKETPTEEHVLGSETLAIFTGTESASAISYADGTQRISWGSRNVGETIPTDPIEVGTKIREMLSNFLPKK